MTNIFANIPKQLPAELFENIVRNNTVQIERIVSKGHSSPASGWYEQPRNEWVIVLQGQAILLFADQEQVHLQAGDYIEIPALQKHKVSWTDPEVETVWLAVHY